MPCFMKRFEEINPYILFPTTCYWFKMKSHSPGDPHLFPPPPRDTTQSPSRLHLLHVCSSSCLFHLGLPSSPVSLATLCPKAGTGALQDSRLSQYRRSVLADLPPGEDNSCLLGSAALQCISYMLYFLTAFLPQCTGVATPIISTLQMKRLTFRAVKPMVTLLIRKI